MGEPCSGPKSGAGGGAGPEVALWDQSPWGANSLTWVLWELEWGWGSLKATIVAPCPPDCLGPKIEQENSRSP